MSEFLDRLRQIRPRVERVPWRVDVSLRSKEEPERITYKVHQGVQWAFHLWPEDKEEQTPEG